MDLIFFDNVAILIWGTLVKIEGVLDIHVPDKEIAMTALASDISYL